MCFGRDSISIKFKALLFRQSSDQPWILCRYILSTYLLAFLADRRLKPAALPLEQNNPIFKSCRNNILPTCGTFVIGQLHCFVSFFVVMCMFMAVSSDRKCVAVEWFANLGNDRFVVKRRAGCFSCCHNTHWLLFSLLHIADFDARFSSLHKRCSIAHDLTFAFSSVRFAVAWRTRYVIVAHVCCYLKVSVAVPLFALCRLR